MTTNIFYDHGFTAEEATVLALRSDVARIIRKTTDGIKQKDAAAKLGIAQGDLSKIRNGHVDALSLERLIKLCVTLGIECAAQWGASPNSARVLQMGIAELVDVSSSANEAALESPVEARVAWTPDVWPRVV